MREMRLVKLLVMNWTPIKRGKAKVLGRDANYSGLLDVQIELSEPPPPEWVESFNHPSGVPISMSMHPPRLVGNTVRLRPPDGEEESYVKNVDARIEAANLGYERHVLPQLHAEAARRESEKQAEQARIEDAQRRLDKL